MRLLPEKRRRLQLDDLQTRRVTKEVEAALQLYHDEGIISAPYPCSEVSEQLDETWSTGHPAGRADTMSNVPPF